MKTDDVLDHVIALVNHFKKKMETDELSSGDASCYIKCLGILGARDAVMSNRNIEKLAEAQEVVELPFSVRE